MGGIDRIIELLVGRSNADPEIRISDIWKEIQGFLEVSKSFNRLAYCEITMGLRIKIN